ncbi:MAG TPA: SRPBCC family protein [Acidimicrobiales bacterium]|jgi:uncharacterized protein YndB with AHSA1/START domain|nr:SRPBCC family protein [Acidimicrobiales bacterium]
MSNEAVTPVSMSRRIEAPASAVFAVLTDPAKHPEIDGSGMLRPGGPVSTVTKVGDVFTMHMFFPDMGDYQMDNHVVAFEKDALIAWEPVMHGADPTVDDPQRNGSRWSFSLAPDGPDATVVTETYDCSGSPEQVRAAIDNGRGWIDAMTTTLANIEALCAGGGSGS